MSEDHSGSQLFDEIVADFSENASNLEPKIRGYLQTHGMSHFDGLNEKIFIDLSEDVVAIVGKNGSGKTTYLTEFALAARPWCEVFFRVANEDGVNPELPFEYSPYWRGGFILDSPIDYMKSFENHGHVNFINLSNPEKENQELIHSQFIPPASALATEFLKSKHSWNTTHYYKEYDYYMDEIRSKGKIGLFPIRAEAASQAQTSADNPYRAGWLAARVVFHNEDTPVSNNLLKILNTRLSELNSKSESYSYKSFLNDLTDYVSLGVDYSKKPIELQYFPILTNPLFTPWSLGGRLVWSGADTDDVRLDLKELLTVPIEISIERPKVWTSLRQDFFIASIDARLINLVGKSDIDIIKLDRPIKDPNYSSSFGKKEALDYWEKHLPRTKEILEEWGVVSSVSDYLNWEIQVKIDSETGNFSDLKGPFNDTARTWIHRAMQIAILEDTKTPYKLAIWDEPEVGLHPSALDLIIEKIIPFMRAQKIKLIFSTHSMRLATSADSIKSCTRDDRGNPKIFDWESIDLVSAQELGFSKIDLLETIKQLIVVEGEMDFVVLNNIFQTELLKYRSKLLTLGGTENLLSIPSAEIIIDSLDSKILIVLDGRLRSKLTEDHIENLNLACSVGDIKTVRRLVKELRSAAEEIKNEGKKLIAFLDLLINRSSSEIIKRFSFFMFEANDISNALPIQDVLGPKSKYLDWKEVDREMNLKKILVTSTSQKDFLARQGMPVNKNTCGRAALAMLDKPLTGDFLLLKKIAFSSI